MDPVRDLAEGGVGEFGVRFGYGKFLGRLWGVYVVHFWLDCLVSRVLGFGFLIWAGIPLFCAVDFVRALAEGDDMWIGVIFGPGGR